MSATAEQPYRSPYRPGDVAADFLDAMRSAGVHIDTGRGHPIADGKLHRVRTTNAKRRGKLDAWYVLHADEPASGAFGDYYAHIEDTWTRKRPSALTDADRRALAERMETTRRERAAELARIQGEARAAAAAIWQTAIKASSDHPYLARKGLPPLPGIRQLPRNVGYTVDGEAKTARAGNLVVPIFTKDGELASVQVIQPDGAKRFLKGTAKTGNYTNVGRGGDTVVIAEGWATAARIHQATGLCVFVAFDSGNLAPVAAVIRKKFPARAIIIAADNDRGKFPNGRQFNPGVEAAVSAAREVAGRVAVPLFPAAELEREDGRPSDFDDLFRAEGIDAVRAAFEADALMLPGTVPEFPVKPAPRARSDGDEPPPHEDEPEGPSEPEQPKRRGRPRSRPLRRAPLPDGRRPVIQVVAGALPRAVDETIAAIAATPDVEIFRRNGQIVRVVRERVPRAAYAPRGLDYDDDERHLDRVSIHALDPDGLVEVATRAADFQKYDARAQDLVAINCPADVARTVLGRRGFGWDQIRPLRAAVDAPTLRSDGTVIDRPGYDADSGLLRVSTRRWPEVPESPTRADALNALAVLRDLLRDFPFVSTADESAALALLLTACVRSTLPAAPAFLVTAPTRASGKSALVAVASILATGNPPVLIAVPKDENELDKKLTAAGLAGAAALSIDNVNVTISSDFLTQMISEEEVYARPFGVTTLIRCQNIALVCATGNNARIHGDLVRRFIRIRLNPNCEKPEERVYSRNVKDFARRRRPALVAAALTVVRFRVALGVPVPLSPYASFEAWTSLIRESIVLLGLPDPRGDVEDLIADDPETETLRDVLSALPPGDFRLSDVGRMFEGGDPEVRAALTRFADRGALQQSKLAGFFRRFRDRPVSGRKLVLVRRDDQHGAVWRVESH